MEQIWPPQFPRWGVGGEGLASPDQKVAVQCRWGSWPHKGYSTRPREPWEQPAVSTILPSRGQARVAEAWLLLWTAGQSWLCSAANTSRWWATGAYFHSRHTRGLLWLPNLPLHLGTRAILQLSQETKACNLWVCNHTFENLGRYPLKMPRPALKIAIVQILFNEREGKYGSRNIKRRVLPHASHVSLKRPFTPPSIPSSSVKEELKLMISEGAHLDWKLRFLELKLFRKEVSVMIS